MKLFAPLINDVVTDLEDPPDLQEGASGPPSDKIARAIRRHYADLAPLRLSCDADAGFRRVLEAAELMAGWKLTVIDRDARILEGYAITKLLRFRDDFVVRVREDGESRSVIDMRSRSRSGKGDFGANASRILGFFDRVRAIGD